MNGKILSIRNLVFFSLLGMTLLISCEEFFYPDQGTIIVSDELYSDWNEYRAAELGLYRIQQDLVNQLMVLGELRGDMLEVTGEANSDLQEVYNFNMSSWNPYASPTNFFRLIAACNNLAVQLETAHPEVLDKSAEISNYDRLYGEVLCMRAWAYFYAVRIFEKVPYIWPGLATAGHIEEYVNTGITVVDTMRVIYGPDGYHNDTLYNDTVSLDRVFLDMPAIVDSFVNQLNNRVKAVGLIHNIDNGDQSWDVTIWSQEAMYSLLGQMYLHIDNMGKAREYFERIIYYKDFNPNYEGNNIPYGLDNAFAGGRWRNIFTGLDVKEHIFTIWFDKAYQQQNDLQYFFSPEAPNRYMLRPSAKTPLYWERIWKEMEMSKDPDPNKVLEEEGIPGDFARGHGVSYVYYRDGVMLEREEVEELLRLRRLKDLRAVRDYMKDLVPVVQKYSINKNPVDQDANFTLYRAGGIHMYYAEIFTRGVFYRGEGVYMGETQTCLSVLNDGKFTNADPLQLGVRGRVGFGTGYDGVQLKNIIYLHDSLNNELTGYLDLTDNYEAKVEYLEEQLLEEKARETAFEGERFYDLVRIAKRRGDPSFLANKVASKFDGEKAEQIRNHLMDEKNWYIHPWD
ncbi:MAG: RagB/SusD family nutrient uptake outer membrane protein [Bacteroidetes bacterium]|nr:RagB/SusD family nutrient uptake outer membrane protein [Bacteroidota bacterium]